MAAISLFWYTNMAAVTSDENDLLAFSYTPKGYQYAACFIQKESPFFPQSWLT
jgi:hypothetical protein